MNFTEYGSDKKEVIILLHGGGLAAWNYSDVADKLKEKFHIIIPALDGHSGSDGDFSSIEENARKIIRYIDNNFGGQVLLIGGLSLGGQILVEILSQRKDICRFAIIESALVLPMKATARLIKPSLSFCFPLIKKHWFAKLQFISLHIRSDLFENYYNDTVKITKENMIAFLIANSDYKIKSTISDCKAKSLVAVGGKEQRIMKKSAEIISQKLKNSTFEILPEFYHGDLSINHPEIYVQKILKLINSN